MSKPIVAINLSEMYATTAMPGRIGEVMDGITTYHSYDDVAAELDEGLGEIDELAAYKITMGFMDLNIESTKRLTRAALNVATQLDMPVVLYSKVYPDRVVNFAAKVLGRSIDRDVAGIGVVTERQAVRCESNGLEAGFDAERVLSLSAWNQAVSPWVVTITDFLEPYDPASISALSDHRLIDAVEYQNMSSDVSYFHPGLDGSYWVRTVQDASGQRRHESEFAYDMDQALEQLVIDAMYEPRTR